ncbi:MAG: 3-hydroxyacyl-CoA dehydrogenase family protein [Bacteroidota bacterium]
MSFQHIALVGEESRRREFKERLPELVLMYEGEIVPTQQQMTAADLLIDLNLDEHPARIPVYLQQEKLVVLGAALKQSLMQMYARFQGEKQATLLGINALPTFLNRPVWEVSYLLESDLELARKLEASLGVEIQTVSDQVGMVTCRVLFLIINEAYIMVQEGTADADAIDTAMKLGTNYPKGPIAWSQEIGTEHVVDVLEALYQETGSKRFMPSQALRRATVLGH